MHRVLKDLVKGATDWAVYTAAFSLGTLIGMQAYGLSAMAIDKIKNHNKGAK
jgi:sulfite exporter TauE/SafE